MLMTRTLRSSSVSLSLLHMAILTSWSLTLVRGFGVGVGFGRKGLTHRTPTSIVTVTTTGTTTTAPRNAGTAATHGHNRQHHFFSSLLLRLSPHPHNNISTTTTMTKRKNNNRVVPVVVPVGIRRSTRLQTCGLQKCGQNAAQQYTVIANSSSDNNASSSEPSSSSSSSSSKEIMEKEEKEKKSSVVKRAKTTSKTTTIKKKSAAKVKKEPTKEAESKSVRVKKSSTVACLPRTRELELQSEHCHGGAAAVNVNQHVNELIVFGVDEAGRGPLCGPVVAAAAYMPVGMDIPGIVDSKKITKEEERERLYDCIVNNNDNNNDNGGGVRWAVAIIDAARIDEINILQATMEGMRLACEALVTKTGIHAPSQQDNKNRVMVASAQEKGCYVVYSGSITGTGGTSTDADAGLADANKEDSTAVTIISDNPTNDGEGEIITTTEPPCTSTTHTSTYCALVDGNRCPTSMPDNCASESIIKGDSKEYCIAAASILAKVTRDRLMREYDTLYPAYNLAQHKGYPTKAHIQAVMTHGASPQHRRTFAPLKHMTFDQNGKQVV
jgi:ribonuclease HII